MARKQSKPDHPALAPVRAALETLEHALGWTPRLYRSEPLADRAERATCAATGGKRAWPSIVGKAQRERIAAALEAFRASIAHALAQGLRAQHAEPLHALRLLSLGWTPAHASTGWDGYSAPWDIPGLFVQTLAQARESQTWSESTGRREYPTCAELERWHAAQREGV